MIKVIAEATTLQLLGDIMKANSLAVGRSSKIERVRALLMNDVEHVAEKRGTFLPEASQFDFEPFLLASRWILPHPVGKALRLHCRENDTA